MGVSWYRLDVRRLARECGGGRLEELLPPAVQTRSVQVGGRTVVERADGWYAVGKSGREVHVGITDRRVARVVKRCEELPGQNLFQYIDSDGERRTLTSDDVNQYMRDVTGEDFTANDFRTWAGTLLAACALRQVTAYDSEADAKRNVIAVIDTVAQKLGHTRAVCRRSYVHPAVVDAYTEGVLGTLDSKSDEAAVLALLRRRSRKGVPQTRAA